MNFKYNKQVIEQSGNVFSTYLVRKNDDNITETEYCKICDHLLTPLDARLVSNFDVLKLSLEDLFKVEQRYIDTTGCLNNEIGYNINQFADRVVLTPEQCNKISLAKKGVKRDTETKAKMWAAIEKWRANATPEQIAACETKRLANLQEAQKNRIERERTLGEVEREYLLKIKSEKIKQGLEKARKNGWKPKGG